jgi:CRP-like cAMP-binding protein
MESRDIAYKDMLKGAYFGEIEIIFKRVRSSTVSSRIESHFLTLSKQIFDSLIREEYPEIF